MNNKANLREQLEAAEQRHNELLTQAGRAPANSSERERLLKEAAKAHSEVLDIYEEIYPTPLA